MDKTVQKALDAALEAFAKVNAEFDYKAFSAKINEVFVSGEPYLGKVKLLDEAFDDQPIAEELREVFFDLLLINFFAQDVQKLEADYLDSKEWEEIEEKTLDRGTELLNLLLYLRECKDEDIEPSLEDYLKEFLLVDEDEFQDEHRIYEDVIANQILTESSFREIAKVAEELPEDSEMSELFYPVMSFFNTPMPSETDIQEFSKYSAEVGFDCAVYVLLREFNQI